MRAIIQGSILVASASPRGERNTSAWWRGGKGREGVTAVGRSDHSLRATAAADD